MVTTGQTPTNPFADMAELPPPIFSTMTNALPKTFAALLGEYQRNGHGHYKDIKGRKTNWSNGQKNALHKRLYLYEQIAREAHAMGSRNGPYRNKTLQVRLEAPITMNGSLPLTTASGSGASGGSSERSFSHAK